MLHRPEMPINLLPGSDPAALQRVDPVGALHRRPSSPPGYLFNNARLWRTGEYGSEGGSGVGEG